MAKKYLEDGDVIYSTGTFLVWDNEKKTYVFDAQEDTAYFEGTHVEWDDEKKMPYIWDGEDDEDEDEDEYEDEDEGGIDGEEAGDD